jgi:3,4-dihydroxy 2-butanone 4-phosphate synthase/GTP cyclohydrolase II
MQIIQEHGTGVVLYMREEGRGIGLLSKLKAYSLQECGLDTVQANRALGFDADHRDYSVAAHMLHALDIKRVRLLTNNLNKCCWLETHGIELTKRIPMITTDGHAYRQKYLSTKIEKMGHVIPLKSDQFK